MNVQDQKPGDAAPVSVPIDHEQKLNDPKRLAALDASDVMDTLPEEAFDRVVRLATDLIGVPVGLVSFVDGQRQFFKAHRGLPEHIAAESQTPRSHSFC